MTLNLASSFFVAEERREEESVSEVTHGWMFIFRVVNYLTTALVVCVHACVYISAGVREMWPAVSYIPQSSPRGQRVQTEIRAERMERI